MLITPPKAGQPLATAAEPDGLAAEFQHYARRADRDSARDLFLALADRGVRQEHADRAAPDWDGPSLGYAEIEVVNGTWQPMSGGMKAIVLPVVEEGDLADLLAFTPHQPTAIYSRTGWAWCAGQDNLNAYHWSAAFPWPGEKLPPVTVFDSAVDWMICGCRGIAVVDWKRAAHHLADVRRLHVVRDRVGVRLKRAFAQRRPAIYTDRKAA